MPAVFTIAAFAILVLYLVLMALFISGWLRIPRNTVSPPPDLPVTILVPCRNEESTLEGLSDALLNQDYPRELMQIIWIDDHSSDGTPLLLERICSFHPGLFFRTFTPQQEPGKKAALKAGMKLAKGDLILLTDADSRPGPAWVRTMAARFAESRAGLLIGPVLLEPADTVLNQIQKLEFMSLTASSAGAAGAGLPFMAQGPNLAVKATLYRNLVEQLNPRFASGDDIFLLQAIKDIPGERILAVADRDAVVTTSPASTLPAFLAQRRRWASKAPGYSDPLLVTVTLAVFSVNAVIIAALILAIIGQIPWWLLFTITGAKAVTDMALLAPYSTYYKSRKPLIWFIPVQLAYPIYVLLTGISALIPGSVWKDRKIN